jgi:hypothetical protein
MGSMITLGVERLEIDWGKNHAFTDHAALFAPGDVCDIPYYYADGVVEMKPGLSRRLESVARRLDLLGYSPAELEERYTDLADNLPSYYEEAPLTFSQFKEIIPAIDLTNAFKEIEDSDWDLGEFVSKAIFGDPEVSKLLPAGFRADNEAGAFFENLAPYVVLRLLALNPKNADRLVQWRFADVVEGGWVEETEIIKPLDPENRVLIVTEGSSDSFVIRRTLDALYPEIADFFHFVDMEEHYPFTGVGNLYRFCQGLSRIQIANRVLVIFDNDAAGVEKFEEAKKLNRPRNFHICRLPDHPDFQSVMTAGPQGLMTADINGSAVAIECFLDLTAIPPSAKLIRWTSFNKDLNRYQGEIEEKDDLVRQFKKANLTDGSYETERLKVLIEHLLDEWITRRHDDFKSRMTKSKKQGASI